MPTISQKIHNHNYAPGIATYGALGKTGEDGLHGSNLFFTNISFTNINDFKVFVNQILNNYMPVKNSTTTINRQYQDGDCFFNMEGLIYTLVDLEQLSTDGTTLSIGKYTKYFQLVGRITVDTVNYLNFLKGSERLELNTDYKGFDVVTASTSDVSQYINSNAVMNIVSDKLDNYNNINFVLLSAVNSYNSMDGQLLIYFDTNDNAFHITTNADCPLIINSDVKVNLNSIEKELDDYSTVLTSADPITVFKTICSNIEYMAINSTNTTSTSFVLMSFIIRGDIDKYDLMSLKFNSIKDNLFAKVYGASTISTFRFKDMKVTTTSDNTIVYQIELNEYIQDSTQVQAVSLLYNTEIFINKYNTNQ